MFLAGSSRTIISTLQISTSACFLMLKLYPSSLYSFRFPSKVFLYLFKLSSSGSLLSHPYHFHDLPDAHSVACLQMSNEVRHFIFGQICNHTTHLTLLEFYVVIVSTEVEHIVSPIVHVNLVLNQRHLPPHYR
jgi:hypothetical protein